MKKIFFGIAVILLAAFFLLPRPLLKPDWRSEYNAAIASGDCERIDRMVSLLNITWMETEFDYARLDLYDRKLCQDTEVNPEMVAGLRQMNEREWHWRNDIPFNATWDTSRAGYLYRLLNWKLYGESRFVRRIERSLFDTLYTDCYGKIPRAFIWGPPDYELLGFALKNPELTEVQIWRLARARISTCAENLLAKGEQLFLAAASPDELASLPSHISIAYNLNYAKPELAPRIKNLEDRIPDSVYEQSKMLQSYKNGPGWLGDLRGYECERRFADRTLEGAIHCSSTADEATDQKGAHAYGYYFSLRAKRLGWRDVSAIEARTAESLSDECRDTIIAHEAMEVEGADDPAFYRSEPLPIQEGEVCAPDNALPLD